jgi:hypothetical protein
LGSSWVNLGSTWGRLGVNLGGLNLHRPTAESSGPEVACAAATVEGRAG